MSAEASLYAAPATPCFDYTLSLSLLSRQRCPQALARLPPRGSLQASWLQVFDSPIPLLILCCQPLSCDPFLSMHRPTPTLTPVSLPTMHANYARQLCTKNATSPSPAALPSRSAG